MAKAPRITTRMMVLFFNCYRVIHPRCAQATEPVRSMIVRGQSRALHTAPQPGDAILRCKAMIGLTSAKLAGSMLLIKGWPLCKWSFRQRAKKSRLSTLRFWSNWQRKDYLCPSTYIQTRFNFLSRLHCYIVLFFAILAPASLRAQAGASPFDLIPRLSQQADSITIAISSNPFDIVSPMASSNVSGNSPGFSVTKRNTEQSIRDRLNILRRFQFGVVLAMLVWMTLLFIIFRIFIVKVWEAFLNENILNQLMRERSPGSSLAMLLFYLFFVYNAGLFLFLSSSEFGIHLHESNLTGLLMMAGGLSSFLFFKHFEWLALKTLLPAEKELSVFSFTFMVFNIVIGLLLVPVILFVAYAPASIKIYTGLLVFGLVYLYLCLRGLLLSGRFLTQNRIHFLLYLCAAEIAPVLLLFKLLQHYTGVA